MLFSAKKKPPKENLSDNTKLLKINSGKAAKNLETALVLSNIRLYRLAQALLRILINLNSDSRRT